MTDVRSKGFASRNVSIREKEADSINASSSSENDKQEADGSVNDNASQRSNEHCHGESETFNDNRIEDSRIPSSVSSMELQTYKTLTPLLPAADDRVEETPPASIFVIEVDVNHVNSVTDTMDEESIESKEKG